jgi:hypothetical protein
MIEQRQGGVKGERSRKRQQLATIVFHLLQQGRSMSMYETLEHLFLFLNVSLMEQIHETNSIGWGMANFMFT